MQSQTQAQTFPFWRSAPKYIEFAFEEGGLRTFAREEQEEENVENGSPRKNQKVDQGQEEEHESSYEPSNEIVNFEDGEDQNEALDISFANRHVVDEITHAFVFLSKSALPTFVVNVPHNCKKGGESRGNPEKSKYIQLFIAQKSHSSQNEKYKIIKGALKGVTKQKIKNSLTIHFERIKFDYFSSPEKLPRFILAVYEQGENKRSYKHLMISEQFSVIEPHKALGIDTHEHLKLYFQTFQTSFLDKTGLQVGKISSLNKYKILQQMGTFENYLIKKNKKITNIVYAAYKYSHIADLYFLNPDNKPKRDQFLELWKQVFESLRGQEVSESEKTCNYLHPQAKFVLKINALMKNVRFFISRELTKHLSIISSEAEFEAGTKYSKFDSLNDLKDAYIICQDIVQAKMISEPPVPKTSAVNSSQHLQQNSQNQKKQSIHHASKNHDDEDFNEQDAEDEDDDVQYEGESSENYSVSNRKRGRKLGNKKSQENKKNGGTRDNKCTTRGGNRTRNKDDTEDSNDKRANIFKKNRQKQSVNRPSSQANNMTNPPFRVLTPNQVGQFKQIPSQMIEGKPVMIQMGPGAMNPVMMMGVKKPEDNKKGQTGMPAMAAMPNLAGMQGLPGMQGLGNIKGVPVMMPPNAINTQALHAMISSGNLPPGAQIVNMGNGVQALMMPVPVQVDKSQLGMMGGQMPGMQMPGMGPMGGMGMMMMGNPGGAGGFMMPGMPQQQNGTDKKEESEKKGQSSDKKEEKKDTFPPVQPFDMSKLGLQMPGGMAMMPGGQMPGMGFMGGMPQFLQMGMPGNMAAMMGAQGQGMPQGMMMNPMMQMPKQSENKDENGNKQGQQQGMQNPLFSSGMPMMMGQMPGQDPSAQRSQGIQLGQMDPMSQMGQLGMMGQFPMMQAPQMGGQGQGGMPMGLPMWLNPEMRNMTPMQVQQMMMMKGMMSNMPNMMQMPPKNDGNDQNKK